MVLILFIIVKAKKDTRSYELYKGNQKDYEIVPIGDYYCLTRGGNQIDNAWKKTNIHKERDCYFF